MQIFDIYKYLYQFIFTPIYTDDAVEMYAKSYFSYKNIYFCFRFNFNINYSISNKDKSNFREIYKNNSILQNNIKNWVLTLLQSC